METRAQAAPTARPSLPPLMAPRRRVALFLLVAATLNAISLALAVLRPEGDGGRRAEHGQAEVVPVVVGAGAPSALRPRAPERRQSSGLPGESAHEDLAVAVRPRARAERTRRRVERRARTFVTALLRRERGGNAAAARRSIRATATRGLAGFVLTERPRVPVATARPRDTRIAGAEVLRLGRGRAAVQVTVRRDGTPASVLLVELVRREGRWRAAALR